MKDFSILENLIIAQHTNIKEIKFDFIPDAKKIFK